MNDENNFDSVFGTSEQREIERTVRQRHAKIRHEQEMRDDIAVRVLIAMIETTPATIEHTASKVVIDRAPGMARTAYHFADAMLAAREGQKKATAEEIVKTLQAPVHSIDIKSVIHRTDEFEPGCKVMGLAK